SLAQLQVHRRLAGGAGLSESHSLAGGDESGPRGGQARVDADRGFRRSVGVPGEGARDGRGVRGPEPDGGAMSAPPRQSPLSSGPASGSSPASPGMARWPDAHAPRSMSLQRSLQNGRYGDSSDHSTSRPQVGHRTVVMTR